MSRPSRSLPWTGGALRAKSDIASARIALLEHSQRLEHEIVNISDAEQRRIGQDLHDGLCQNLAALKLRRDFAAERFARFATFDPNPTSRATWQTGFGMQLCKPASSRMNLFPRMWPEVRPGRRPGIIHPVSHPIAGNQLHLPGLPSSVPDCNDHTATHLYRVAQEAINNATKHGKASHIDVSLQATDQSNDLAGAG